MRVQIKRDAFAGCRADKKFVAWLEANAGKWMTVDRTHLFNNQYNLKGKANAFRIMDSMVSKVREDAREGKGKCGWCGKLITRAESEVCTCGKSDKHPVQWFTAKNTFFIAQPNGIAPVLKREQEHDATFGTYHLQQLTGIDYYRLKNARATYEFKFKDGYFYMHSSGEQKKSLGITAKSFKESELKAYLQSELNRHK